MNWEEIFGEEWYGLMKDVIDSTYFQKLGEFIQEERKSYTIYPSSTYDTFHVFRQVPYSEIKVVVVGMDPYHDGNSDGLAFSNSKSTKISPSLATIFKEVKRDIYNNEDVVQDKDLHRWAQQGVFLINTALTVRAGQPGSHKKEWEQFSEYLIELIAKKGDWVVFMLWGNDAQRFTKLIKSGTIIANGHPSPLNRTNPFLGSGCFSQCNDLLVKKGYTPIIW